METIVKKLYEAMFLIDSTEAASDWDGVNSTIQGILKKADAEVVSIRKWDDRRLAYEIGGKSKGAYILCYFRAQGERLGEIERDVQLSERILRVLILSAEDREPADLEKDTPAERAEKAVQKAAQAAAEKAAQQAEAKAAEAEPAAEVVETETAVEPEPTEEVEETEQQSAVEDSEPAAAADSAEAKTEESEKQADEQSLESS